jgi:hypothetical protein
MSRPALLAEILDLPTAERLRLVEDIWDSLAPPSLERAVVSTYAPVLIRPTISL